MRKVIVSFLLLVSFISKAQLPYLNASTGNLDEFPVDKDTNMYMFIDYRIIKLDKNLNTIWSKTTSSAYRIRHLLLSKTGSLYFIASNENYNNTRNTIGKIDRNGNIVWLKYLYPTYMSPGINNFNDCYSVLLDRNNDLVISGNIKNSNSSESGFFLKMDTTGTFIKLRKFDGPLISKFSIAYDSLGYYKFIGGTSILSIPVNQIGMITYNDLTDQILNSKLIYSKTGSSAINWHYMRSRFNNNFYLHLSGVPKSAGAFEVGLLKCNINGLQKWNLLMAGFDGLPLNIAYSRSANESSTGDIYFQHDIGNYSTKYKSGVFKIDSIGITNGIGIKVIDDYPSIPNNNQTPQSIDKDHYFVNIKTGAISSSAPIELYTFTSNLYNPCTLTTTCTFSLYPPEYLNSNLTHTLETINTSFLNFGSINSYTTNHQTSLSNCTYIGILENTKAYSFKIHPNPTSSILKLELANSTEVEEVHVMDVNGKIIKTYLNCKEISVSDLALGIYFLQLKSDGRMYYSKFIKE